MSATALRCRVCEAEYPTVASGSCVRCWGPLEPVYDWEAVRREATRERIEAGPYSLWRYEPLLPVPAPADAASGPGWTPLVSAPRLAREAGVGGGTYPCVFNAANEVAVQAFLDGRIGFLDIGVTIEHVLENVDGARARDVHDLVEADAEARRLATVPVG